MNQTKPIALVTGGNRGIGRAVVKDLVAQGYQVYNAYRGAPARLTPLDDNVIAVRLDVTDIATIKQAVADIEADAGKLDVLINNAGVVTENRSAATCSLEGIRSTYEVNLLGVVAVTQALLPLLRKGQRKTIVNVSSSLGSIGLHGYPESDFDEVNLFAYNSSKAALNMFTVLLAKELKDEGFRINSVNPGYTDTELNNHQGHRTVEQASAVITRYATLEANGPTGDFLTDGGRVPW